MLLFKGVIGSSIFMSACVLPLAPEFQDPPASANYSPFFITTEPEIGAIVTTPSFRVVVSDPNIGDNLVARWIANFPPATGDTRVIKDDPIPHSADGKPLFATSMAAPVCIRDLVANLTSHRIMVVIADRPFDDFVKPGSPDIDFARLSGDALKVVGTWTLDKACNAPAGP